MIAPWGKPTKARRFGGFLAGVSAHAVAAGIMASTSGSAIVAPTPCRTRRRGMCFFDKNMESPYFRAQRPVPFLLPRTLHRLRLRYAAHAELIALYYSLN